MQEAFQIGCTPEKKKQRYLCWSLMGMITSTNEDTHHSIEITLNDVSKSKPKRMTDHFGFTKAAIGESGAIFASSPIVSSRKTIPATIYFRPFEAWTSQSEWSFQLDENENPLGVAIGSHFVAIATDLMFVRIFTLGGIQVNIFSIPGPFLCFNAIKDKLAVVYHRSAPFNATQNLSLLIYNYSFKYLPFPSFPSLILLSLIPSLSFSSLSFPPSHSPLSHSLPS